MNTTTSATTKWNENTSESWLHVGIYLSNVKPVQKLTFTLFVQISARYNKCVGLTDGTSRNVVWLGAWSAHADKLMCGERVLLDRIRPGNFKQVSICPLQTLVARANKGNWKLPTILKMHSSSLNWPSFPENHRTTINERNWISLPRQSKSKAAFSLESHLDR